MYHPCLVHVKGSDTYFRTHLRLHLRERKPTQASKESIFTCETKEAHLTIPTQPQTPHTHHRPMNSNVWSSASHQRAVASSTSHNHIIADTRPFAMQRTPTSPTFQVCSQADPATSTGMGCLSPCESVVEEEEGRLSCAFHMLRPTHHVSVRSDDPRACWGRAGFWKTGHRWRGRTRVVNADVDIL